MTGVRPQNRSRPAPARRAGQVFRDSIEKAVADGADREAMTLRLTLRDVSDIKRDRDLAVSDVSFGAGGMRFMGVKVVAGGVDDSRLDLEEPPLG